MSQADPFPAHRYQGLLRFVRRRAEEALRRCGFDPLPPFKEFVFTRHHGALILFLVLDEKHLERPTRDYLSDGVLHEISTLTRGLKVARSNSNGARYAILLSRPARLPKSIPFPDNTPPDAFPLGMTRSGPLTLPAEQAGHFLVGGAPRSGKSNFLTGLAFTAIENGWSLCLADPQGVTFSHDWNRVAAHPVASSLAEFTNLLAQAQAEMTRRGSLFETVRKPSGLAVQKIEDYNRFASAPLPRLLLVVDEANTYLDKRGVTDTVADLARQGLKYGIHLALAAHSWRADDIPRGASANFAVRLTFRVEDDTSGQVVLSSVIWGKRAMRLRQEQKGRGVIRCNGEAGWLQTYLLPEERLAERLMRAEPAPRSLLPDWQIELVRKALDPARPPGEVGRMSLEDLAAWNVSPRQARLLAENWEARGWLTKGINNARFVTRLLEQAAGMDSGLPV